ncbi:MAG TPA: hypothetical protein VKR27_01015, partial [Acidimicrobiales bacterium]|nr:hypothetical protein [Acidimicrobiales bacterium]
MPERDRVRRATEDSVSEAGRLLDQARGADGETRLMILITVGGRGLAAGLEELALAVESMRQAGTSEPASDGLDRPGPRPTEAAVPTKQPDKQADETDRVDADEESLRARAAESREATAALRD